MSKRILVINDDKEILDLFCLILEPEGYEVHLSLIRFEDIHEVEVISPDLIILDAKLGYQAEGLALLQQLRMYRPTCEIPIILCTAAIALIREQEDILRDKGVPVIYKPFDIDELLQVVQTMLLLKEKKAGLKKNVQDIC